MIIALNFCPVDRGGVRYLTLVTEDGSIAFWEYVVDPTLLVSSRKYPPFANMHLLLFILFLAVLVPKSMRTSNLAMLQSYALLLVLVVRL